MCARLCVNLGSYAHLGSSVSICARLRFNLGSFHLGVCGHLGSYPLSLRVHLESSCVHDRLANKHVCVCTTRDVLKQQFC